MPSSFLFYDVETTGISPRKDRIMQFAAQRTDMGLKLVGKPIDLNIKLTPDILPAPEAILTSSILPSENQKNGITEAEFAELFNNKIVQEGTIFVGFNNLRFDDEFIRYTNYRNFYDAYAWHWQNSSSRWDILDVVRLTRALRPEGINWPFKEDSKPTNRLELLTAANNLSHANAHDALSDTLATIEVAALVKSHQPKLFSYLLSLRKKQKLIEVVKANETLVYCSSHYSSDFLNTTVVAVLSLDSDLGSALVVDLRQNVSDFLNLSVEALTKLWEYNPEQPRPSLPVKTMKLNRCPAIAPISVLDEPTINRLKLNMTDINNNLKTIQKHKTDFVSKLNKVIKKLDERRDKQRQSQPRIPLVDERLYDNFIPKTDALKFTTARAKAKLRADFELTFTDNRLNQLYSLYRARNYPGALNSQELHNWQAYVHDKLFARDYMEYKTHLNELLSNTKDVNQLKLLKDLNSYVETIANDYEAY